MSKNTSRFYDCPGFEHAAANSGHATTKTPVSAIKVYDRAGRLIPLPPSHVTKLQRYRNIASVVGKISATGLSEAPPVSNWPELYEQVTDHYIQAIHANFLQAPIDIRIRTDVADIFEDARGGLAQTKAFLQVIPKVLANKPLAGQPPHSAESLLTIVRRSKGFIIKGSALHDDADQGIAYGVAAPKPDFATDDYYTYLQYSPLWFKSLEPDGAIGLDPDWMLTIRNRKNRSPVADANDSDVWFGCPAHLLIPGAYNSMTAAANRSGLFLKTYLESLD